MDAQIDILELRLNSLLLQLQIEYGLLDRFVYKNKNQHRRCGYFQYLLKVRRDLRLLQSVYLEDLVSSCFHVITEKKPIQKLNLLESLKKRKCDGGKPNFLERLLGAARLLSQMVEPMLKAATNISIVLAQSFFMSFSLSILALLARLRVLVQQILLDIVSAFNIISLLSLNKQSVKINRDGIEVFREYYPTYVEAVMLECLWETDKFVLHEKMQRNDIQNQDFGLTGGEIPLGSSSVQYKSIDVFLGDDEMSSEKEDRTEIIKDNKDNDIVGSSIDNNVDKRVEVCTKMTDNIVIPKALTKSFQSEGGLVTGSNLTSSSNSSKIESGSVRKVAFLSVKRPAPSTTADSTSVKQCKMKIGDKENPIFGLLTNDKLKESLF